MSDEMDGVNRQAERTGAPSVGGAAVPAPAMDRPRTYSSPPLSVRPVPTSALRRYEDAELLARAWQRLEENGVARGSRRLARSSRVQVVAAAALFVLGIGVGRWSGLDSAFDEFEPGVASEAGALARPELSPTTHTDRAPAELRSDAPELRRSPHLLGRRGRGLGRDVTRRPVPAVPDKEVDTSEGAEGLAVLPPSVVPTVARPAWLLLAERGDFAGAFSELEQNGSFEAVLQASSAEELMTLADVARFAGRDGRAILALREVTQHHQDDPNAPLAAMMLGNLLQRAGDRTGAAEAYALNRALSPDGDFAEDALVRELDLMLAEPNLERAVELFQKYQTEFPSGARLATLRARVDALRVAGRNAVATRPPASGTDSSGSEPPEPAGTPGDKRSESAPGARSQAEQRDDAAPDDAAPDDAAPDDAVPHDAVPERPSEGGALPDEPRPPSVQTNE